MRIRFVARRWWPAVGGVETFARDLARGLAARGHDVAVLAHRVDDGPTTRLTDSLRPPPPFSPFEDGGVRVEPLVLSASRRAAMAPLLTQVLPGARRFAYGRTRLATSALYAAVVAPVIRPFLDGVDVVHMLGHDQLAAATVRAARAQRRPVIITPFAHEAQWGDDAAAAGDYRRADAVVALLAADAELYRRLGVADDHITVIGICSPGVEASDADVAELRSKWKLPSRLVLFLGVRRPYKGADLVLAAAPGVRARCGDVGFAFVGPGARLQATEPWILDVGEVGGAERAAWLSVADVLCLPSEGEIFPASILEAWSADVPVVTSDIPTLAELVQKSAGGIATRRDPGAIASALGALLEDPERRRSAGAAGRAFWERHHTVAAVCEAHETLYAQVAK